MPLNAKQRAEYLDILKAHGGEKAYHAGLDVLQTVDSGKSLPKPKVAKGAQKVSAADAKKFGLGSILGGATKVFCGLQCAKDHNPKKDPLGFAACVFQCIQSSSGGGGAAGGGNP
ncbi:MAG: hypothetical protein DMF64_12980 [Acidobacteria bacterium]|nr:MAG: hypothetical protein DMF64_12980 [Acidobacteriota bacterium]